MEGVVPEKQEFGPALQVPVPGPEGVGAEEPSPPTVKRVTPATRPRTEDSDLPEALLPSVPGREVRSGPEVFPRTAQEV